MVYWQKFFDFRIEEAGLWCLLPFLGRSPDRRVKASALPLDFLGMWVMVKSKVARRSAHRACQRFSFIVVVKLARLRWSESTVIVCAAPSRYCHHMLKALTIASSSFSPMP